MNDKNIGDTDSFADVTECIESYQEVLRNEMRNRYFVGEDSVDSKNKIPLYIEDKDDKPIPLTKELFNYLLGETFAEFSVERICSDPEEIAKLVVDNYFKTCDGDDGYDPLDVMDPNDLDSNNPDGSTCDDMI